MEPEVYSSSGGVRNLEASITAWHFQIAVYFAFGFCFLRLFLDRFVFQRIAVWLSSTASTAPIKMNDASTLAKLVKCKESLWKLLYYGACDIFVLKFVFHEPWATDVKLYFEGWPNQELKLPIKLYYMCECGFYMYAVAALLVWETRRKDFSVTMSHHVITIILLAYSYLTRLIHCWEARNFKKANMLMGVELLLIDSKSTTMHGFISTQFLPRHKDELKPNTIYKLNKFSIRASRSVYRVSPHNHAIGFTSKTTFVPVPEGDYQIDSQHFRIRDLQVFTDIVDRHTDLFDIIGFLRVINGDNLDSQTPMATAPTPNGEKSKNMVFLHVQLEDGETARVYLWDTIAATFRSRWNDSKTKPSVILITTLNSKTLGGVVTLSSTASTRLFFDSDIIETEKLLSRFEADGKTPPTVNSSTAAVTKVETVTLNEIHKFLENESPQVASFICTATITEVMEEYGWYFISCTACKWQLERSETSFICPNSKCKKPNTVGLIRYRFEVKVRDDSGNEATFVIFDKEALKLVVRQAPDVMNEMSESGENGSNEDPGTATPQCVLDIVGRTCTFQVKVNDFNFKSARTTAIVSRIVDADIQNGQTLQTNDEKKDGKRQRLN